MSEIRVNAQRQTSPVARSRGGRTASAVGLKCGSSTEVLRVLDVLRIVNYPNPVLRYVSRPVTQIDDDLHKTVRSMFELLYAAKGIGLAANQVALPFRFFVLNLTADPAQADQEQVFINPVITKRHLSVEDEEGCLSLPDIRVDVRRAKKIRFQAYDLERQAGRIRSRRAI